MTLLQALSTLRATDAAMLETRDAAALLGIPLASASSLLARLATSGQIVRLRRGRWAFPDRVDPLALPEYLTAPFPSYVSLQSALYLHGMISQVPVVTYAVSLARTRRIPTPLATVSIHHVVPPLFFGFEPAGERGHLATPEKALVDFLYLRPARSKLFRALPELRLPPQFNARAARAIVKRIPSLRTRVLVSTALEALLHRHS